jgi:hypothetical protein
LLVVPPGTYHGWISLEPDTKYNRERPDEYRVPPNNFDASGDGNPWEIKGK